MQATLSSVCGRRLEGKAVAHDQPGLHLRERRIAGLGSLGGTTRFNVREERRECRGDAWPEAGGIERPADLGRAARVRDAGPGSDGREIVSDHVRDHEHAHPCGRQRGREPACAPA
jgi:hypothetical protein